MKLSFNNIYEISYHYLLPFPKETLYQNIMQLRIFKFIYMNFLFGLGP